MIMYKRVNEREFLFLKEYPPAVVATAVTTIQVEQFLFSDIYTYTVYYCVYLYIYNVYTISIEGTKNICN